MIENPADAAVSEYVDYLSGLAPTAPDLDALDPDTAARVRGVWRTADLMWESQGAPPLENDPVASMLGLVPAQDMKLAPASLQAARKKAALKTSEVAECLRARGWDVSTSVVFTWERGAADDVPPALITVLADILGTDIDRLTTSVRAETSPAIEEAVRTERFAELAARWARIAGLAQQAAEASLRSRMLATVRRGGDLTADEWLHILEALVDAKQSEE